jgi:hypothetical protein
MAIDKLLARIKRRKYAYRRMFMGENGQLNADGQAVLADLAKFCRATASTAVVNPISRSVDPLATAMAEGRREVWLRIMAHLHIDDRVVFNLNQSEDQDE